MAGAVLGRRFICALVVWIALAAGGWSAQAAEALDGAIQAHGFAEIQARTLNRDFAEEFDLAQWYNVLNLEIELDFLPNGWGPFDLLQGYIRAEGRYDCIYTHGCGLVPPVNTYGNQSRDLPLRLRDAQDFDAAGTIRTDAFADPPGVVARIDEKPGLPSSWAETVLVDAPIDTVDFKNPDTYSPNLFGFSGSRCPPTGAPNSVVGPGSAGCIDNRIARTEIVKRQGFPGFDTLFDSNGADGEIGDQPDFVVLGTSFRAPTLVDVGTIGPGTNFKTVFGTHFRALADLRDDPGYYALTPVIDWKFAQREYPGPIPNTALPMGPWLPRNRFETLAALSDRANPLRGRETPVLLNVDGVTVRDTGVRLHSLECDGFGPAPLPGCAAGFDPIDPRLEQLEQLLFEMTTRGIVLNDLPTSNPLVAGAYPNNAFFNGFLGDKLFGGDFSGIIPCWDTAPQVAGRALNPAEGQQNSLFISQLAGEGNVARRGCIPLTNVRVTGGDGELPMRAAPDFSNLAAIMGTGFESQGLFIPSYGLTTYAAEGGDFDSHEYNITETDRAFNRGASQRSNYEVKEAYIDAEFLESRLWIRAGIQNIVWGKTELFRTTDQFNPQDLALATLPALEESRVALLSWRAVYSLYDVGPLEDVRIELAMNFDRNKPADLGACGEPYTPDIVCGLTLGTAIHSVTGIGVAAVDRPPAGWEDVDGLEYGGRVEFRWDRFSFAVVDFYGYNDFPYPDPIFFYERNVDPDTGLPRKANARGECQNRAAFTAMVDRGAGPVPLLLHAGNPYREAMAAPGSPEALQTRPTGLTANTSAAATNDDWWRRKEAYTLLGIAQDPDCLKPGGAPGFPNENRYTADLAPDDEGFAAYSDVSDTLTAGTYVAATVGGDGSRLQWTTSGSSVDYALAYHPGNQQLFNFICSATVSIAVALAPEACAWNLWGADALLIGTPFSEIISLYLAGDRQGEVSDAGGFTDLVIRNTKGSGLNQQTRQLPLATLNSDVRDGRAGAVGDLTQYAPGAPVVFFGVLRKKDSPRDIFDLITLDQSLTWQQKALLGCGPAYGTRCDSGAATVRVRIKACIVNLAGTCPLVDAARVGSVDIENETNARSGTARFDIVMPDGVTPCDPDNLNPCRIWGRGGGMDFLNAEASVILQSMVGFDGTEGRTRTPLDIDRWVTWAADTPQPGTIGLSGLSGFAPASGITDRAPEPFVGGVVCTRYAPDSPYADSTGLVTLPGCRGAVSATVNNTDKTIDVVFDPYYSPSIDGCTFGRSMVNKAAETFYVRAMNADGTPNTALQDELFETCFNNNAGMIAGNAASPARANTHLFDATWYSYTRRIANPAGGAIRSAPILGAGHLFHPLAQCEQAGPGILPSQDPIWNPLTTPGLTPEQRVNRAVNLCKTLIRDYENDFLRGNAQVFRNELAAVSFNLGIFLTLSSCNSVSGGDDLGSAECFDPNQPWATNRCSLSTQQFCRNVKGFLSVGGLSRNDPRAGGNESFGRRDFIWHSGGELALKYARRNVFGFSADFAEDHTKTNWGMEFTWIGATPWIDNNSLTNTTNSDSFNLTISVDRPTFINFLNANRTFFFNSQWFFNYIPEHTNGFTTFVDPFNVLFTFAVFTGYYQDRLLPQLVTVYDFGSHSGGFLPQVGYRFTESLSVTFGVSFFVGRSEFLPMPVRGFAPDVNRAGPNAYQDGVLRLLANVSRRDEAWMRLRWTF